MFERFRLDDADGYGVVVTDGVVEEGDVAAQLDDGEEGPRGRDNDDDGALSHLILFIARKKLL